MRGCSSEGGRAGGCSWCCLMPPSTSCSVVPVGWLGISSPRIATERGQQEQDLVTSLMLPWPQHGGCCGRWGASLGLGFQCRRLPELLTCRTWFTLVFLSSTGLSHLHPSGARWVQGESGRCYLCCISSLHVGAARARWEDRSLPAAGAWPQPLLRVAAGPCSAQLILSPSPKSWGLLQGTGAAVPALLGKDQAHTTDGQWYYCINTACIEQWEPEAGCSSPVLGQAGLQAAPLPCSSRARLLWAMRACAGAPAALSRSWPGVAT